MKLSIFTPLYAVGNSLVEQTYRSLRSQTLVDWEWVVLENNGGRLPDSARQDPRVRVFQSRAAGIVGALKAEACGHCTGDVLVELDHDDLLAPNALERIAEEFEKGAHFVYSDFAEFHDGSWVPHCYHKRYGWSSYDTKYEGRPLLAMRAPEATPQNLRRVEFAPNHVRAWHRGVYNALGGHDASLRFGDDHDLVLRTYLGGYQLRHIPECLYFYRVHTEQNCKRMNSLVQQHAGEVYDHYIYRLAQHFAEQRGLMKVDLCGGHNAPRGFHVLDRVLPHGAPGTQCDLNGRWPLEDSSVGVLRAFDALEHLQDPMFTMREAWRVLAPGGFLLVMVPSTDGRGAFQDPTHVSFWNENSFLYYSDRAFRRYLPHPELQARFQVARCRTVYPSERHEQLKISYVQAELIALKDGYAPMGEVLC